MDKLPYREFLAMIQEKTREADIPYSGSFELMPVDLCSFSVGFAKKVAILSGKWKIKEDSAEYRYGWLFFKKRVCRDDGLELVGIGIPLHTAG